MQLTEQMLREAFQQTQREILANGGSNERYKARWQRMAEVLNEKLEEEPQQQTQPQEGDLYMVKIDYHHWNEYRIRAEDDMQAVAVAKTGKVPTYSEGCYNNDGDITVDRVEP